jgi:hypothetical protein
MSNKLNGKVLIKHGYTHKMEFCPQCEEVVSNSSGNEATLLQGTLSETYFGTERI